MGTDGDQVYYLVPSTPEHSPTEIVSLIRSVTEKGIFAEHPEVKKLLWGGEFWGDWYFILSVGRKFTGVKVIKAYVKNQRKERSAGSLC